MNTPPRPVQCRWVVFNPDLYPEDGEGQVCARCGTYVTRVALRCRTATDDVYYLGPDCAGSLGYAGPTSAQTRKALSAVFKAYLKGARSFWSPVLFDMLVDHPIVESHSWSLQACVARYQGNDFPWVAIANFLQHGDVNMKWRAVFAQGSDMRARLQMTNQMTAGR